jgi:hypothetical protein
LETANIPVTQESLHVKIKNEDGAHDTEGIVHFEFIQGQTVNQAYYAEILR